MSLGRKTLLLTGFILITAVGLLYVVSKSILVQSFVELEQSSMQNHVQRVLNAVDDDLGSLDVTGQDWAYWSDTYDYMLGDNPDFAEDNLYDEVFFTYRVNVILLIDRDLRVKFGRGFDVDTFTRTPVPYSIWEHINADHVLMSGLQDPEVTSPPATRGILALDEGPLLFVSLPVLHSDGTGPSAGVMIWGRFLNESATERLSSLVRLPLSLYTPSDSTLPPEVRAARAELLSGAMHVIRPLNEETIAGYAAINDVHNTPAVIIGVQMPRDIYRTGVDTVQYFMLAVLTLGLLMSAVLYIAIERFALRRLTHLTGMVSAIATSGQLNQQVAVRGNDEISTLSVQFNRMIAALRTSQQQLKDTNQTLEERVAERTNQLVQINEHLQTEIEERKRAQHDLTLARDHAVEALRLKTQILANVSHDSRTPLNAILGYAEMLKEEVYGPLEDKQKEALLRIMSSCNNLLGFINNLLDSAKLETNNIQPHYSTFPLLSVMRTVEDTVRLRAREKQLELKMEIDPDLPELIYSDERRLGQIVTNLVVNAIKFTDTGWVQVRYSRSDDNQLIICVQDTGRGIPADKLERIFEAFWQVDGSPTRRNNSGVGLGLAIVRALVHLLQGEIQVESEVGKGSMFTVTLPMVAQEITDGA